jgi:hypothetical protein
MITTSYDRPASCTSASTPVRPRGPASRRDEASRLESATVSPSQRDRSGETFRLASCFRAPEHLRHRHHLRAINCDERVAFLMITRCMTADQNLRAANLKPNCSIDF